MDTLLALTTAGQSLDVNQLETSDTPLIVHIDFKSPYAFLAIEPTRQMLAKLGLQADWRPFVLDIGSYLGTAKLAKDGKVEKQNRSQEQWSGVKYAYFDCRRYANLVDQTIRGTVKIWDTNLLAIGMWWLKRHESLASQNDPTGLLQRFIDAVYLPFWRREFDAEDLDAIVAVLSEIGAPTEGFIAFAEGDGAAFNDKAQATTFDRGVYGVPTYQLPERTSDNGKPEQFFGREHLPRIAALLSNDQEPLPDVAYTLPSELKRAALEQCAAQPGVTRTQRMLPVYFDFKSPNSYLALRALMAARAQGLSLSWRPFEHKPLKKPAPYAQDEDRAARHRRVRGEYVAADIQRYAPHPLQNIYLDCDCAVANMGLLWLGEIAPDRLDDYVQRVFTSLWQEQADIAALSTITELLRLSLGALPFAEADWTAYTHGLGLSALGAAYEEAKTRGVSYAPTVYLGDEPFQGRAQLPLVLARCNAGV